MGLESLIASTAWGAALVTGPLGTFTHIVLEFLANWLANNGLIVLNVGANFVKGEIDQISFDKAFGEALQKIQIVGKDNLTPEQGRAIDDAIKKAADKFLPFNPSDGL